ncbi:ATP-binding cassette domain-containing protein [Anaerosacchariphilus polymeriproducens]|uniref:ATP-binding cassette domain-containing protein n=1 Tax=Anaerosacchariphilus polymeriproducens TaxID=1812858 RepID=A0A371AYD7_9FIRM|nr:ATP-binding cassette domain-containing protein [Anaerosacchariphilus polymeriproducens]RDU24512.1 ATP-binding cassette domain-containing protein [Anaerosacchariphilus polymeriproducens]
MKREIISVENVTKQFKEQIVLNDVSIEIKQGEICGIVGRNGSGKTVLFKCICGFLKSTSGKIFVRNQEVGKDIDIPRNLGVIIESPGFLNNYSGYRNLELLATLQNKISKSEILKAIQTVGLEGSEKKKVGKYSMGMRQRLGIAQAIMENQDILILDEPMNGLDKSGVNEVRNLLLDLKKKGYTILLASHNQEDINVLCDTVFEMDNGNILKLS